MNWRLRTEENKVICINNKMEFFCALEKKGRGTPSIVKKEFGNCFHTDFLTETNSWLQIT